MCDVGSNDGTLLRKFTEHGKCRTAGIEPATEIARRANLYGVETWCNFFDETIAKSIVDHHGQAKLVTANNVMAHIDDLRGVMHGVQRLLRSDGVFVFEVQYAVDLYEKTLFDMIYSEHLDFHTVGPLKSFIESCSLTLFDVERVPTHGGSIRCYVSRPHQNDARPIVDQLVQYEKALGIASPKAWWQFSTRLAEVDRDLEHVLMGIAGRIVGYGAPAKACTLMHRFDIDSGVLEYIVDDSPYKIGLYTPGKHILVRHPSALVEFPPKAILVLAWNFASDLITKCKPLGVPIIVPLPDVRVVRP